MFEARPADTASGARNRANAHDKGKQGGGWCYGGKVLGGARRGQHSGEREEDGGRPSHTRRVEQLAHASGAEANTLLEAISDHAGQGSDAEGDEGGEDTEQAELDRLDPKDLPEELAGP